MKNFVAILLVLLLCVFSVPCLAEGTAVSETAVTPETTTEPETAADPVLPSRIAEGSYEISVTSSSSMFKIVKAILTVKDGAMSAVITLSGTGYGMLFMGTGEEALLAAEDAYIPFAEDEEGAYTYEVPVEALDQALDCAAWSTRKETWYDRTLVFESTLLPPEALLAE